MRNIFTVQHYKKYLYYNDNVIIDDRNMSSNIFITIEAENKNGGPKVQRTVDLYHIYLLLVF